MVLKHSYDTFLRISSFRSMLLYLKGIYFIIHFLFQIVLLN